MVRFDLFLFGYKRVTFPRESLKAVANLLLREGIAAKIEDGSSVYLKSSDCKRLSKELSALGAAFGEVCGLPKTAMRLRRCPGVLLALVPILFIFIFSRDLVWDIRIEGEGEIATEAVLEELRCANFHIGSRWSRVDCEKTENELLLTSENISWISINRRGVVAYVKVAPKISREDTEDNRTYSNIVARYDCIIEEITVASGYAEVSVGDAVSRGDLLISGVIPDSLGGGFCHAEGVVRGRITRELSSTVDRNEMVRESGNPELSELSLQIFDFSINIFKKYGKVEDSCDIIKDVEDFVVFGSYKLPLSLVKKYTVGYNELTADYKDDELVKIATARLMSLIRTEMYSADVVAIRTEGEFTDTGYTAVSRLTVIVDAADELFFEAE